MNRYLSTVGLYARWNLYKILTIILITALAAGFLVYRYPIGTVVLDENHVSAETGETTQLVASYPKLEGAVSGSGAPAVCAAGFAAIVAVMSLTGCGYGVKTEYTIRRLRVKERRAVLLWAAYHAALLVAYWAVLAAVLYGVMHLRLQMEVPVDYFVYTYGPQSMLLLCYTDTFLHHLLPLRGRGGMGRGDCLCAGGGVEHGAVLLSPAPRKLQRDGASGAGWYYRQLLLRLGRKCQCPADGASAGRGGRCLRHADRR